MRIKGAIFDMDGLLLDTEAQSVQCWPMAGREMGYEITAEMVHAVTGSNPVSYTHLLSVTLKGNVKLP